MPQEDPYRFHARGLDSPATRHVAITPSDSVDLPEHLAQAIAQTRRVVYPDDWTAAVCPLGYR